MQSLPIHIAKAILLARLKQTLVAAAGVTFGITMFIALLSFMTGLNDMLDGLIINRTPHIKLYSEVKPATNQVISKIEQFNNTFNIIHSIKPNSGRQEIYNASAILKQLRANKQVLGVAPKVSLQVFYSIGKIDFAGNINGIEVFEENKLFYFSSYVTQGNYLDLIHVPGSIILGKAAAEKMMVNLGDVIQVTTVKGERLPLKVVGFFQSGLNDLDKVQSYTDLSTARKLLGKPNTYITDLQVKLHAIENAPTLAKQFKNQFGIEAEDIQTTNAQFETGTKIRTLISYTVGITLLIVAGFGIYNILNMMIYEKMDTIAILKATGFSGNDVKNVFIYIAISIGLAGGIVGLILGFLLSYGIDYVPFVTPALPTIKTFPVNYNPQFYIIGILFSLITTFMAGLFPALKASKIDPVQIIRGK
jgi:lipoprotein-releasing system permease protein